MPNRWESSKRPLFVRTVVVNGNRHAILSQEDPLCQQNCTPTSRKQSRPSSSQSYTSTSSNASSKISLGKRFKEGNWEYDNRDRNTKNTKITNDLQGCLVKLRLVLETNEKRKTKTNEKYNNNKNARKCTKMKTICDNYRRRKRIQNDENKNCSFCEQKIEKNNFVNVNIQNKTETSDGACFKYDSNQNITNEKELSYYYYNNETSSDLSKCCCEKDANLIEIRDICCCETENNSNIEQSDVEKSNCDKKEKKFVGNYCRPYLPNVLGEINESWNNVSSDSFFSKPFYNPLSERVLQWLDLASKKKTQSVEKPLQSKEVERISAGNTYVDENGKIRNDRKIIRSKSEGKIIRVISKEFSTEKLEKKPSNDIEEEVKTETDVETVLSTVPEPHVYPKYSSELNRTSKSPPKTETSPNTIPNKEESSESATSNKLQESITDNFNAAVSLKNKGAKKNIKAKKYTTVSERRSLLMRQSKFQETSDEDEHENWSKQQEMAKLKRNAFSHRNSIFSKTIECNTKSRVEIVQRYKEKYMNEKNEDDKADKILKHLQNNPSLSSHLQNKIPWLRDYHHGTPACRNMWPSDKATSKPQLHIFMPAISPETKDVSNGDESISECESYLDEL